jgi:hypothetical protein
METRAGCECGSPAKDCSCELLVRAQNLSKTTGTKMPAREADFDLNTVMDLFPEAYEALPEPYKNDSCLTFFLDVNGNLCAEFDLGGEFLFVGNGEWTRIK